MKPTLPTWRTADCGTGQWTCTNYKERKYYHDEKVHDPHHHRIQVPGKNVKCSWHNLPPSRQYYQQQDHRIIREFFHRHCIQHCVSYADRVAA